MDDVEAIKSLDESNMIGSIEELYLQLEQAWGDIQSVDIPESYSNAQNVIVVGMGGSALGPHVVQSLYSNTMPIPMQIVNDYHIPKYASTHSIVLLSSNSGSTEEVLQAATEAKERGCMLMGMSTGGALTKFLQDNHVPSYIFVQRHNPSGQPRMGNGYMILGMLGLFHKAGLIHVEESDLKSVIALLQSLNGVWGKDALQSANLAKQFATTCVNHEIMLVGSSFLVGNVHAFNNQLNENAKNFSTYFVLPEINHHLMEGLGFPKNNAQTLIYVFIHSDLYEERIRKRYRLTEDVVRKNGIQVLEFVPPGKTRLEQSFATLLFGSYFGFYIAMLNGLNPSPIPWVDYFKAELAKV